MHSCPYCGQACTCCGDIDDLMFDDWSRLLRCVYCQECFDADDYPPEEDEGYGH